MNARVSSRLPLPHVSAPALGLKRPCGRGMHDCECPRCRAKLQRSRVDAAPVHRDGSSHERESLPYGSCAPLARDFTRMPLHRHGEVVDGAAEDEDLESIDAPGPTDAGTQPTPAPRPTGTKVDTTTSYTQAALQAGYLSGLGIVARMQVLPDSTTWDGKEVVESLQQTSSTCPDTLTRPGPCNGHSHFPIGSAMRGRGVRPEQPAMRNRFYDIHTSQSLDLSFLHDATRNPKGIDSCECVCRQDYAYDGVVIGSHSIRRQFRKGKAGGHDVTIIDVTKTDLAPATSGASGQTPSGGQGGAGTPRHDGGAP